MLKFQMISSMNMFTPPTGRVPGPPTTINASMMQMFYQMIMWFFMSISDDIFKGIPVLFVTIKNATGQYITGNMKKKIDQAIMPKLIQDSAISLNTRHYVNTLEMTRLYLAVEGGGSSSSNSSSSAGACDESNAMVDAILTQISRLHNVPSFSLIKGGHIMVNYKEKPIQLTKDIYVKIASVAQSPSGDISSVRILLLSNTLSASEITTYVRNMYHNWQQELKNSLGNNIYFFDQKSRDTAPPAAPSIPGQEAELNHKRMIIQTAPKQLSFTMTPFYSNKSFANIYGDEVRLIEKRLRFFIENRDWYDQKGIPYQLGILLSGIPGAGKTSVIRAIANMTRRHIVNVNFANINTATQLKNLFYNDKIQVYADQSMNNQNQYFIPIDQRIYVLEEIDAIGDIVKQRSASEMDAKRRTAINDELTLAEILTVLDGTMEIPGRIVVMTTNHPEVLDQALIRPGRIDVQVHFSYSRSKLIAEMFEAYMDTPFPSERLNELPDRLLSPAEVGQVLFKHFGNVTTDHGLDIDVVISDMREAAHEAAQKRQHVDPHAMHYLASLKKPLKEKGEALQEFAHNVDDNENKNPESKFNKKDATDQEIQNILKEFEHMKQDSSYMPQSKVQSASSKYIEPNVIEKQVDAQKNKTDLGLNSKAFVGCDLECAQDMGSGFPCWSSVNNTFRTDDTMNHLSNFMAVES